MKKSFKSRVVALLKKDRRQTEEVIDNSITLKGRQCITDLCPEIERLTTISVDLINTMTNKQVSYSNVNFLFKRNYNLQLFTTACINTLEDKGIDSRDLSIAFSNSFSNPGRCLEDVEGTLEDGEYILDVPQIVIERAMLWLTEQVITDSPYNARIKRGVPQAALKSNSAFDVFLGENKKK